MWDLIERLWMDNRSLTVEERKKFMNLLYRSCLGIEAKFKFDYPGKRGVYFRKQFNRVVFDLLYHTENTFELRHEGLSETVPMGEIWKEVLLFMFEIWGLARERASSMSVERVPFERAAPQAV